MTNIEKLFTRLDLHPECQKVKCAGQYLARREFGGISLYHYGVLLGKVRPVGDGYICVLGYPTSQFDVRALNGMWAHYKVGRRVYREKGKIKVEAIDEQRTQRMKLL